MKRLAAIFILLALTVPAKAEKLQFSYTADAEVTSCYIWRGIYNGGLSFQPELAIGWRSEHTSLDLGTWWNVGASDWGFRSGLPVTDDNNPNTMLTKELDITLNLNLWGATVGFIHYYYLDGTDFLNFGNINDITGSAQTEVYFGYDFSTLFPDVDMQVMWYTRVSGEDGKVNGRRAYSTYIEASYRHHFRHDVSLTGVVGISPWKGAYTDIDLGDRARNFAVNNLTLRVDKTWTLGKGLADITLYAQGTMNTCNINRNNAIILASGDDKLEMQKLMGAVGVRISF